MGQMYFNRTLKQWKEVDPNKRTKYDAYISSSLSRLGNQRRVKEVVKDDTPRRIPFKNTITQDKFQKQFKTWKQ